MSRDIVTTNPQALATTEAEALDQNPALVYLAGLSSERSRNTQRQALEVLAELVTGSKDILACNWAGLRYQHTQAIRSKLAGSYAPATANRLLTALRGTLKAAWRLELISAEAMLRACDVKAVKGKTLPAGRALSRGEIEALIGACENDPCNSGARDAALLACMYPAGLRREEVSNLDLADYDPATGNITVKHGKGNKERITTVEAGGQRAMADWLAIRGSDPGPLFFAINKAGKIDPKRQRITHQAIYNVLAKRAKQAKVKDISPHDLRRTFVTDYIAKTGDISGAKVLAGHESITTTDRYNRAPLQKALDGMGKLHFPYSGRAE